MSKVISALRESPVRHISVNQAAHVLKWPKMSYGPVEVSRSHLINGVSLASAKASGALISSCTIMFQAGSRYEINDYIGATHFIRACSALSGCLFSGFIKTRYLQQHGGFITCNSDRETISFTLRCPQPTFTNLKWVLLDTAYRCQYYKHEVKDKAVPRVLEDLNCISPRSRIMDLIQKASFSGSLYNSVFCPKGRVHSMKAKYLKSFAGNYFRTGNCTIGTVGIPFEEALALAEKVECSSDSGAEECPLRAGHRSGYEVCDFGRGKHTWVALAVPATNSCSLSSLFVMAILTEACGTGSISSGSHFLDHNPQPPLGYISGADAHTKLGAFNIAYRDLGIFGILLSTRANTVRQTVFHAAEFISELGNMSPDHVLIGKRRLKLRLCLHDDRSVKYSEGLAMQMVFDYPLNSSKTALEIIDGISVTDVLTLANRMAANYKNLSMAVVGDVGAAPILEELV